MKMKSSKQVLNSLLKTTQMGQYGIQSVLKEPIRPALQQALESQLNEYDAIEREAHNIASQRGWEVSGLNPMVRMMANMGTRMRLSFGDKDSKIAGMMIQGNTRGMILGLRDTHQLQQKDIPLSNLAQKLLDTEHANIRQMQGFL
ncbi:MAG: hypothetical protein ACI3VZ_02845 [Faecousia sp.]